MKKHLGLLSLTALIAIAAGGCDRLPTQSVTPMAPRWDEGPGTLGSGNAVTPPPPDTSNFARGKKTGVPTGRSGTPGETSFEADSAGRGPGTLGSGN